jgi:Zn-dependent protease
MLAHGQLACPRCGALVYAAELTRLADEAQREESGGNVIRAAMLWREAMQLLPPDSRQHHDIAQRVAMLTSHFARAAIARGSIATPADVPGAADPANPARPVRPNDPWRVAVAKTAGSMLISIAVYAWMFSSRQGWSFGIQFATGFVLLILIHELGHSLAMRYFGLSASPPIFIPFLGAVINLRQMPRNALEEAIVGIGGPVTGTLAAGITYVLYLQTGWGLLLRLAEFGFLLNLFNMLPVPPLDGGRVTAAVSPWIWIPGLLAVAAWVVFGFTQTGQINPIFILLLLMAWPRVLGILRTRNRNNPYYQIGWKAKWTMGAAYLLLTVSLVVLFFLAQVEAHVRFGGMFG